MTELNKIIAVEKTANSQATGRWTRAYQNLEKRALFDGKERTYHPDDEEHGERFPDESQVVQLRAEELLQEVATAVTRLFDIVATKDWGNTQARADVKLPDGTVLFEQVPVPYLLFLEKQFVKLHDTVSTIPVVDPRSEWKFSDDANLMVTEPTQSIKTKKVPRQTIIWTPPTSEYRQDPKWTEWQEDVVVGHWETINYSGAVSAKRKQELIDRVEIAQAAIKSAREEANSTNVTEQKVGKRLFDYLFAR